MDSDTPTTELNVEVAYKVVLDLGPKGLWSISAPEGWKRQYIPGIRTNSFIPYRAGSERTGLLCFSTEKAAHDYMQALLRGMSSLLHLQLWKVHVSHPIPLGRWTLMSEDVIRYWSEKNAYPITLLWPHGTVAYKYVTLVERLAPKPFLVR